MHMIYLMVRNTKNPIYLCCGGQRMHVSRFGSVTGCDMHMTGSHAYWALVTPNSKVCVVSQIILSKDTRWYSCRYGVKQKACHLLNFQTPRSDPRHLLIAHQFCLFLTGFSKVISTGLSHYHVFKICPAGCFMEVNLVNLMNLTKATVL
jgi:hypothetical protein